MPEIQGGQFGGHNLQINLFGGEAPRGPVVAGNVPQAPPAFQPREDLIAQLRAAGPGVSVVRAVTGMRGVGKTQLAAAYARECIDAGWRLVAWINAEDAPSILNGLAVVADRLGIGKPGTDLEIIGGEVRNRLEADGERCLIVFDNVTDPDAVRPYIPSAGKPQVVVTSAHASALALGKPTRVDVFTEQESLDFLAGRTGRDDSEGATALAGELGHLPLALVQAAAVIQAQRLTYPVYLKRLRDFPARKYLPAAKGDHYPRGVAEAILLSMDIMTAADPAGFCRDLLDIISLLSPEGVSRELLYSIESAGGEEAVDEALGRLADASLLTFSGDDDSGEPIVTAHRLTARVACERRAHDGTLTVIGAKARAMLDTAAGSLAEPWQHRTAARNLVRHIIALNDHLAPDILAAGKTAAGKTAAGKTAAGKTMAEDLLDTRGWALWCLCTLGDSASQAIELGEALVADQALALGEDHPETLASRGILAVAYRAGGRAAEVVPLLERTLADQVRVAGESHPDTLVSRNNLAMAYYDTGRVDEAVLLLERTLADRARVAGESHPDTLVSRNNLAMAYQAAGRLAEAISLYERTLADLMHVLGEDHPTTLGARSNLAFAYRNAGRLAEAVPLYEQALAGLVRVQGEGHPATLTARNNLADAYQETGRLGEAVPLYEQALAGRARVLGEDHPETLMSRNNLADAYQETGRLGEAVPLFEQALAGLERVLGEPHPDIVIVRGNLARARREAGQEETSPPA